MTTPVMFRRFNGEILALLPAEAADTAGQFVTCYAHIGQHGAADYNHCIATSRPATPAEYASLKAEMESLGYNLKIVQRRTAKHRDECRRQTRAFAS